MGHRWTPIKGNKKLVRFLIGANRCPIGGKFFLGFKCPPIVSTVSLILASASVCACRTISTSSIKNRPSIGSKLSPKITWSMPADRSKCSMRFSSNTKVIQHGVSMYFGSADKLNREHLNRLKNLVKRTGTPFLSDHLCWGSVDGTYTHDLLADAIHFRGRQNHRAADHARRAIFSRCPSASKMSAAMPSITFRK